jgi:hypothetical protein
MVKRTNQSQRVDFPAGVKRSGFYSGSAVGHPWGEFFDPSRGGQEHTQVWWVSYDLPGGARAHVCLTEEGLVSVSLSGKMTTRALQTIPLGALRRDAALEVERAARRAPDDDAVWTNYRRRALRAASAARPERGRRLPDRFYAGLGARYVELALTSSKPTTALAAELTQEKGEDVSVATVRDQLAEARRRELLSGAENGRAGGRLTEKGTAALESNDEEGS